MSEKLKAIAERIKELRQISGIPVEQLAAEFRIEPDLYQKYEAGSADIPVSLLYELSQKFHVELTTLLTGGEPRLHGYCLVRNQTGPSADRRKDYKYQDLAFNFANKKAEVFLVTVDPKPAGAEVHYNAHPGQEFTYMLEGDMKIVLDGHELELHQGDSLYFNSGMKHAMIALHGKPARFLAFIL
ncbi:MAG TPA: XRE family transcriptional regulator [Candidatus Omnitrophota bacterium]|nr:XRE family transcriptional regulator [Candidatus Omnitrophota bacterium]HQJ14891.1 XRE family transcriptional regulator [Candidatus Omnitrophota bacterium]